MSAASWRLPGWPPNWPIGPHLYKPRAEPTPIPHHIATGCICPRDHERTCVERHCPRSSKGGGA